MLCRSVLKPVGGSASRPARRVDARQSGTSSAGWAEFRAAIADAPASSREPLGRLADALERDGLVKLASFRVGKECAPHCPDSYRLPWRS